jgi:hypothetical protein
MNNNEEEYDFSTDFGDAINKEVESFGDKPQSIKSQTTYKSITRKTYPESIITNSGEVKPAHNHIVLEETDLVEFNTTDYVIFSKEAIEYVMDVLSSIESKRFNNMQHSTKTCYNVVFNGQYPHNRTTLIKQLGINGKQFERFIRKLKNKGILYVIKGISPKTCKVQNTYIINPFISRKRKNIHKDLCTIFADVQTLNKSL